MLKIIHLLHSRSLFVSKGVIRCYIIRPTYKKSFQYQICDYFENLNDARTALEQYEVSTQVKKTVINHNLVQKKFESICQQINHLSDDYKISQTFVNNIDKQCLSIVKSLTYSQILNLLNSLLKILPNGVIETQFYNTSIEVLLEALEYELLSQQDIIHLLFFISLKKDKARSYINYLKLFLPDIKDMSLYEKCVVAEAYYKSSVKLDESQCKKLENCLNEELQELMSNSYLLVSVCKAIRLSKPSSKLNLTNLSNAILRMKEPFNFMASIHILSLYAEALIHEPGAVGCLIKDCMQTITQSGDGLRLKDLDRFLWCISHLGFCITQNEKDTLMRVVERRLEELKSKNNVGFLVNILLSLHMLKSWNSKVIEDCFDQKVFEPIYYEKFHWKVRSRLHLLISQINIEMDLEIPVRLRKEIRVTHPVPEEIDATAKILDSLVEEKTVQSVKIECPIKALRIPGISLTTEACFCHIDVLNNFTCLRNTSIPHGLMQLKLRLLPHLKYRHILIEGNVLEKNPDEIRSTIQEQLSKNIDKS